MTYKMKIILVLLLLFISGFILPESRTMPVAGATSSDWNKESFWYEPWGLSGVHKGVDIFAVKGVSVVASANLIILYQGSINRGGNVVIGLGPKWRLHYFAHLESINPKLGLFSRSGSQIGAVGDSGNAKGKQPHLHYSVLSLVPLPWLIDNTKQGYKKAFYINPSHYFSA